MKKSMRVFPMSLSEERYQSSSRREHVLLLPVPDPTLDVSVGKGSELLYRLR